MERTGRFGLLVVAGLALSSVACGGGMGGPMGPGAGAPKQPMGHLTVQKQDAPDDAPDGAKTITVEYKFDRDVVNKDFEKSLDDGFQKKGLDVKENIKAHSHFDVKDAKITGTVTYVKKGIGFSIISADLVAEAHYDADVRVDFDVQVKGDTKNAKDGDWDNTIIGGKPIPIVKNVMPTNIPIAGPLFLHAHFDLSAACDVQVEGSMHATTGVGIAGDVRLAAHYKKDGFEGADGKKQKFQFESKAPNFELAPRPYLTVTGGKQRIKGRCMLQPTAVLLLENSIGAKIAVEPYVELEAKRATPKDKWQLDAQAGVSVNASTEIQFFGRQLRKPKEYTLYEIALTKKGDEMGSAPKIAGPAVPTKGGKASTVVASNNMLDAALGSSKPSSSATPEPSTPPPAPPPPATTTNTSASIGSAAASPSSTTPAASSSSPMPAAPPASPSTSIATTTPPPPAPPEPGSAPSTDSKATVSTSTGSSTDDGSDEPPPPPKKSGKKKKPGSAVAKGGSGVPKLALNTKKKKAQP